MCLDICMASDDNYAVHLGICIVSIAENNSKNINMHILDNNISKNNICKFKSLENQYNNLKINFYNIHNFFKERNIGNLIKSQLEDNYYYNLLGISAFSRLFLQDILPEDIDKVLYLDADTIVLDSLDELFNMDFNDNIVSGVIDVWGNYNGYFHNLKKSTPFINSGVLLINLKKWREMDFAKLSLDLINNYEDKAFLHDQNIINVICGDDIELLHPKFNTMSEFFYVDYSKNLKLNKCFGAIDKFYSIKEIGDALKHPVVVHFLSQVWDRPWISQSGLFKHTPKNPYNDSYHYYKSISPWKNEEIQDNTKKLSDKIYFEVTRFTMMHLPVRFLFWLNVIKYKI